MDKKYVWNIILNEEFEKDGERINRHSIWTY